MFIDDMIVDGFFSAIECSLKFILNQTDSKNGFPPLFQAILELSAPDMFFR